MEKLLNLGCGHNYLLGWTNLDFVGVGTAVKKWDLRKPLPFESGEFDGVYHSHVLEHLAPSDGFGFMKECFRVLKVGGVLRVVVPDLEQAAKMYLDSLQTAKAGGDLDNHEWMTIELIDQLSRHESGGEMKKALLKEVIPNEEFVRSRVGILVDEIRHFHTERISPLESSSTLWHKSHRKELSERKIGKFRNSGEVHRWMYDEVSLGRLLRTVGFTRIQRTTALVSDIPDWADVHSSLDVIEGKVRKPESLFMEGVKE